MYRIGMFLEEVSRVMREEREKRAERLGASPAPTPIRVSRPKPPPAVRTLKRA